MKIIDFLKDGIHIKDETLIHEMLIRSEIMMIKKGNYLVRQGQISEHVYFLIEGICRGFFVDINGKDITDCLVNRSGSPLMATSDFGLPAPVSLQALVDMQVFRISIKDVKELIEKFSELQLLHQRFLIEAIDFHRELKIMSYQYTAAQRYHWFLKKYPDLINKISHKYVASFLNMSPITLSRLINMSDCQKEDYSIQNEKVLSEDTP